LQYTEFGVELLYLRKTKQVMKSNRLTKNKPFQVERYDISEIKNAINLGYAFVYFLFKKGNIVYVGQSVNHPISRVITHFKDKDFDSYSMIKVILLCRISTLQFCE